MASKSWTIRDVLDWATRDFTSRGIESPRLDAELLVAEALGIDRVGLYLDLHRPLLEVERSAIRPLVARRRAREPVAYILGRRDFFGRRFLVTRDVLIPRPDTETLVEVALERIPAERRCRVVDVGTGSGAIAVTIAAERPMAEVTATDVSQAAVEVARANAEALGVAERVELEHRDLLDVEAHYDVVVSNPPYVASSELEGLEDEVRDHEPKQALEAGEEGLDVIRRLVAAAARATRTEGELLLEVGAGQAHAVVQLALADGAWELVEVRPDLDRIERVVHLRRIGRRQRSAKRSATARSKSQGASGCSTPCDACSTAPVWAALSAGGPSERSSLSEAGGSTTNAKRDASIPLTKTRYAPISPVSRKPTRSASARSTVRPDGVTT